MGGGAGANRGLRLQDKQKKVKCWSSELPAVGDGELGRGFAALASFFLHLLHDIHALDDTAEHNVLSIEPAEGHFVSAHNQQ